MKTRLAVSAIVVMTLAACGSGGEQDATADTSAPQATTTTSATGVPTTSDDVVVYVAMGDSGNFAPDTTTGAIFQYAEMLSEDLGAQVDLRDHTQGGQESSELLALLRSDEGLRKDLAEAQAVTLNIPIAVWVEPFQIVTGWNGADPAGCGGPEHTQCLQDALDAYTADTDAILDELTTLADPHDVMIRIWNVYMINIGRKLEVGALDTINPFWQSALAYLDQSAAEHSIPVADTYEAFNGPDGTDDPYLTGLIEADQLHPTAEGATLIAELLHDAGPN
jgi:hypothetical protein